MDPNLWASIVAIRPIGAKASAAEQAERERAEFEAAAEADRLEAEWSDDNDNDYDYDDNDMQAASAEGAVKEREESTEEDPAEGIRAAAAHNKKDPPSPSNRSSSNRGSIPSPTASSPVSTGTVNPVSSPRASGGSRYQQAKTKPVPSVSCH